MGDLSLMRTARNIETTIRKLSLSARRNKNMTTAETVSVLNALAKLTAQYIALAKTLGRLPKRMPDSPDDGLETIGDGSSSGDDENGDPDAYEQMSRGV